MSYSWDEVVVTYELDDESVIHGPYTQSMEMARQEWHRLKAVEALSPERYRNIRLKKRTTTIGDWEDVTPAP